MIQKTLPKTEIELLTESYSQRELSNLLLESLNIIKEKNQQIKNLQNENRT